jgi:hypothetical protein
MAILRPKPPIETTEAFSKALPAFLSRAGDSDVSVERFTGGEPAIPRLADLAVPGGTPAGHDPQQVFVLGLGEAAENAGIQAAKPIGWRLFAGSERGKTVLGNVSRRPEVGWKMTACYYGDRAWEALDASRALDSLRPVESADYELRVLSLPGLNLEGFWLVAQKTGSEDLMVPFPAVPADAGSPQNEQGFFTMANFLAAIRPRALLQMHASPDS